MQFPESWLRQFCNPPISSTALCDLLTMAGMEVEDARPVAPPFSGVVVGHVVEVSRHPSADRLSVCEVDVGEKVPLHIVCGAPNVRPGIKVPCARVGATLPPAADGDAAEPFRITLSRIRGVESQGMLCSARELRLSEDHGGLLVLDPSATVGRDVRDELELDDTLITLKLTPNLGHALSVFGVAREVAALTGAPLLAPDLRPVPPTSEKVLPVRIEAADLCGRFSGRVVSNVNTRAQTPAWMVDRLARCGQRSVSPLVDISNYVMFEYGRPSHIFDLGKIHEHLVVRWAREGERLELLNGATVALDPGVGVIADAQAVESLAGIMGGAATAVSDTTCDVYVEAAFWWPESVAGRARRFNFSTDAGHRFERGVDPASTVEHVEHITRLILEICGTDDTRCGPIDDQVLAMPARDPVTLRVDRAARVLGVPVSQEQCESVFRRLGLAFESAPGRVVVTPPTWRFDLRLEEDLIEEVIRVIGYDALPETAPEGSLTARVRSERLRDADALRVRVADLGYRETINFSFVEERWERELAGNADPIRVLNPIASSHSVMRSSLVGSLVGVLGFNLARKASRVRVFELGRVFRRDDAVADGPLTVARISQPLRLAGLAFGPAEATQWGVKERAVDFFDVKGDVEALFSPRLPRFIAARHPAMHPGRCAQVELDGRCVGHVGELHPRWRQAYELPTAPVVFELEVDALGALALPTFKPLPRQQAAWRDLALVGKDDVAHDAVIAAILAAGGGQVRSARLFDIYKPSAPVGDIGPGERSLAVRLEILDDAVTLTDERIDAVVGEVRVALERNLGLRLRGRPGSSA